MTIAPWVLLVAGIVVALLVLVLVAAGAALRPAGAARLLPAVKVGGMVVAVVAGLVALIGVATTLFSPQLFVTFPVRAYSVTLPEGVEFLDPPSATLLYGGLDRFSGTVDGLGVGTRMLLASGALAHAAMVVLIAVLVSRLAGSLQRGDEFRAGAGKAATVSSIAVFLGGGLGSVLTQLGELAAGSEVLEVHAWSYTGPGVPNSLDQLGWPASASVTLTFEWWPLLIAAALAAVAVAFRSGERLQRDTEGLV